MGEAEEEIAAVERRNEGAVGRRHQSRERKWRNGRSRSGNISCVGKEHNDAAVESEEMRAK